MSRPSTASTGLTKTVALELATFGVTANCVSPGYVWTPLVEHQIPDTMKARGPDARTSDQRRLARRAADQAVRHLRAGRRARGVPLLGQRRADHRRELSRSTAAGPRNDGREARKPQFPNRLTFTDLTGVRHEADGRCEDRERDAAHQSRLSQGALPFLQSRIPGRHLSHRPGRPARGRAGAARGRRADRQIRIHPHAGFHRLRRLHRDPGR